MSDIKKERVIASMTRGFFEGCVLAYIDHATKEEQEHLPMTIKQWITKQYGNIATHFTQVLFPLLIALNFDSFEEAMKDMQRYHFTASTSTKLLLRYACQSREFYDWIQSCYRRQITALLEGRIERVQEHLRLWENGEYSCADELGTVSIDMGIRTVVRAEMFGYAEGLKMFDNIRKSIQQPTILRIMVNGIATLLHDGPFVLWDDVETVGLDAVYRRATLSQANYELLVSEMNQAYDELSRLS